MNRRYLFLLFGLVWTFAALGAEAPKAISPAEAAVKTINQALTAKRYADARTLAQGYIAQHAGDPRLPEFFFLQGLAELKGGNPDKASRTWQALVTASPKVEPTARALEQMIQLAEEKQQAIERTALRRRLLADFPNHAATMRVCVHEAEMKLETKDYKGAAELYELVKAGLTGDSQHKFRLAQIMASPESANPKRLLAEASQSLEINEIKVAIPLYEELLRRNPVALDAREARTKLGWCYYIGDKPEDYDRAERLWREVIQSGPAGDQWVGESQWHIAQLLAGPRGKVEDAAQTCQMIAKTFPVGSFRNEQSLFARAWLFWTKKQWGRSKEAFGELIAAYPEKKNHPAIMEYIEDCNKGLAANKKASL